MNVILCDDRADQLERYSQLIDTCAKKHNVPVNLQVFANGDNLLFHLEGRLASADLLYMDIHMTGTDGMRTAEKLRAMGFTGDIIFLTVDREMVFQAFDVEAMHYLLKEETDWQKFDRVFAWAARRASKRRQEYISLSCAGESVNIPIDDLLYFSLENRIITAHYITEQEEKTFEFYSTLEKLANMLCGEYFEKNHRNQIVSIRQIKLFSSNRIVLKNNTELSLSTRQAAAVRQAFAQYHGQE